MQERYDWIRARWQQMQEKRLVQWLMRHGRTIFLVFILGLLVYQLFGIGWGEFFGALPTSPLFYLLFLGIYFTLPLCESVIYSSIWPLRFTQALTGMLRKRVYNKDVVGYSGEVFLALWAARLTERPRREIASEIKDNFVISVAVMTLWTIGLIATLLLTGQIALLPDKLSDRDLLLFYVVTPLVIVVLAIVAIRFRKTIFRLPTRVLAKIGAIHVFRVVIMSVMQVLQWMVVMPEVSLQVWFSFLAVLLLISRIPILPSRDLIFVGAGIEISKLLSVPPAPIAGMLIVSSALDKLLNFVLFTILSRTDPGVVPPSDSG